MVVSALVAAVGVGECRSPTGPSAGTGARGLSVLRGRLSEVSAMSPSVSWPPLRGPSVQ